MAIKAPINPPSTKYTSTTTKSIFTIGCTDIQSEYSFGLDKPRTTCTKVNNNMSVKKYTQIRTRTIKSNLYSAKNNNVRDNSDDRITKITTLVITRFLPVSSSLQSIKNRKAAVCTCRVAIGKNNDTNVAIKS